MDQKSSFAMTQLPSEHQLKCPFSFLELERPRVNAFGEATASYQDQLTCPDRRCCVWLDLHSWFGLDAYELPIDEFRLAFTDIAHGGAGLYEKLIVLGHQALETFSDIYINEQFDPVGIPADLLGGIVIPEEITRLTWTQKRVERLMSPQALHAFAKAYLSTAQSLPTQTSCVKFVKACIGYSIQLPKEETRKLFDWMPPLTEHIYWSQRLKVEEYYEEDNETLQDLQEYFGYSYTKLIPRIREVLTSPTPMTRTDAPTGKDIIKFYACDYFRSLAEEASIPSDRQAAWITDETNHFLASMANQLFAACWLNLGPYLTLLTADEKLPDSPVYVTVFESLVAACYVLSSEEKSRVWMSALIHRLRQIQLSIQIREIDLLTGGPTAELERLQGLDINRWSSLSNLLQNRHLNWTLAGLDDISVAALSYPSGIPSHLFRKAEKEGNLPPPVYPREKSSEQKELTFSDLVKETIFPCLRPKTPAYPIKLFDTNAPFTAPLELIPIHTSKENEQQHHKKQQQQQPMTNSDHVDQSFWRSLANEASTKRGSTPTNRLSSNQIKSAEDLCDRHGYIDPPTISRRKTSPIIFKRNRKSGTTTSPSCSKAFDIWKGKARDEEGHELWRPPGAIFMKRRKCQSDEALSDQMSRSEKNRTSSFEEISPPPSTMMLQRVNPSSSSSSSSSSSYCSSDGTKEDDHVKLDIKYSIPVDAKPSDQLVEAVVYLDEDDAALGRSPVLKAVLDMTPEERVTWEKTGVLTGRQFRASLYTNPANAKDQPVHLDFVPKGPTGSPRVYISGSKGITSSSAIKGDRKHVSKKEQIDLLGTTTSSTTESTDNTTTSDSTSSSENSSSSADTTVDSQTTTTTSPTISSFSSLTESKALKTTSSSTLAVHSEPRRIPSTLLGEMSPTQISSFPHVLIPTTCSTPRTEERYRLIIPNPNTSEKISIQEKSNAHKDAQILKKIELKTIQGEPQRQQRRSLRSVHHNKPKSIGQRSPQNHHFLLQSSSSPSSSNCCSSLYVVPKGTTREHKIPRPVQFVLSTPQGRQTFNAFEPAFDVKKLNMSHCPFKRNRRQNTVLDQTAAHA